MERRYRNRLLSILLTIAITLSLLPGGAVTAQAAGNTVTGSISGTVRLDYDQSLTVLQRRQLQAELLRGSASLGTIDLTRTGSQALPGGYTAAVTHRSASGGALQDEWPGSLDFSVAGLPQGTYTLRFTGVGYTDYEETFDMEDYAIHVIVGTGDGTFSLGDFNADNRVNEKDRDELSEALGSSDAADLRTYDLNGDGAIDIIDLSYVNWQIGARGGSEVLETVLLTAPVDVGALRDELAQEGVTVVSGSLEDLFTQNGEPVTFKAGDGQEIVLPIVFQQSQELEEVRIITSDAAPILAGTATVEDEYGRTYQYAFDQSGSTQLLSAQETDSVITIDLGQRVAVKKITITVTKTETGYATVESIEFLKEMTPADPDAAGSPVSGLKAVAGDEQVSLTWNRVPNITGYLVTWWPTANPALTRTLETDVTRAEVTGLDNFTEYQFTVCATEGDWTGKPSAAVAATPKPASAPSAPDMVNVSSRENALAVSWKAAEGATWYEVYYTDQPGASTASYTQFGSALTETSTTITGLENGVTYYIYIIAGNDIGRSGPSRISTGTPEAVVYARPAGIPTQGILDYQDIASIRLAQPGNYNASVYPNGFDPKNMADGDYRTHWTVRDWWHNEHVVVTFKEPQDLRAVIWVPRLDGTYTSNLRAYSVQVWYDGEELDGPGHLVTPGVDNNGNTDGGDVHTWPAVKGNPSVSKFAVMPFVLQKNVRQISVAAEQAAYREVSLSEIMFLKYDENFRLPEDIAELFADDLRTQLASGVTQQRIDQLRARLNSDEQNYYLETSALADELNLAEELLNHRSGSSVMVNGIQSRSSSRDSQLYGQGGSDLQPLGVAAGANQEITVYASGIPDGASVTVYATQFNAEASAWRASIGTLENGRNVLTVPKIGSQDTPRGGSLYLTYSGSNPENIRLHIRRAVDIPVLEVSDWNALTRTARMERISAYITELDQYLKTYAVASSTTDWRNVTEISTPSVLLSLPAGAVQAGLRSTDRVTQLENSILAWEDLLSICRTVQGISGMMESRQNIRCMQMFTGAFMYAAGSHIGIGYGSCAGMTGGAPLSQLASGATANSLFGWGIAHEIGHNMDKLGKAEITNNIYALAAQTSDGKQNTLPSRLETSGKYAAIFNKTAQGRPGASGDVFVQLGMYWQLHLAYDEGSQPLEFYTKFFTAWKVGTYFNGATSYDDKVALTAAGVANRDLTEFFTRWGMTLSDGAKAKLSTYPAETRAVCYLNDQSRRDRLNSLTGGAGGTVTAQSEKIGDNQFQLTFSAQPTGTAKVQGFEIQRNGMAIAFTTANTFTDTIGSGNNLTYTYTVVAYDTLGNRIGSASTENQKVSYDLLVDPAEYTFERTDSAVTFTMKQPTPVSGLRLPLENLGAGNFQVTVKLEDGTTVQAASGDFVHGNQAPENDRFIHYLQMANASADDARIATYQAAAVTITGIPSSVADADIKLISYAGDDISFLNGATVGRMKEEYRYGTAEDAVIKAGTLVVTGTFRGDPMYNTVRIEGEFAPADMKSESGQEAVGAPVQRYLNGTVLLFADEQPDGIYTNIYNGIFIFIPDEQAEKELQESDISCGSDSILPSRIRAELWRTDTPDSAEGTHRTAQTLWINSPGGSELPLVEVKGGGNS